MIYYEEVGGSYCSPVQFQHDDEKVLGVDGGDGYATTGMSSVPLKTVHFMHT